MVGIIEPPRRQNINWYISGIYSQFIDYMLCYHLLRKNLKHLLKHSWFSSCAKSHYLVRYSSHQLDNLEFCAFSFSMVILEHDWPSSVILLLLMEEIRRSPVEVGSLSHYLQGFSTIPGGCLGLIPSTVSSGILRKMGFVLVPLHQLRIGVTSPLSLPVFHATSGGSHQYSGH